MKRATTTILALAALLLAGRPVFAAAPEPEPEPDTGPEPAEEPDGGTEDAPIVEPAPAIDPAPGAVDPFDLPEEDFAEPSGDEGAAPVPPDDLPDGKPFAKGDMELGLGLGGAGDGEYFQLVVGGTFAYYVVNRLAPGIDLQYSTVFHEDYEYPSAVTALPFLKFVILRARSFAPFLILTGGREFQWGGSDNPFKGVQAAGAWIVGGGAGAHVGIGDHFSITVQILALYYWYDDAKIRGFDDDVFDGQHAGDDDDGRYVLIEEDGSVGCDPATADCYAFYESDDRKDLAGELFFPMIHIGLALSF
jgi:hypothetical protein